MAELCHWLASSSSGRRSSLLRDQGERIEAMARRSARHKKADVIAVAAALDEPRISQERAKMDLRRRIIVGDNADLVLSSCPLDVMYARRVHVNGLEFGHDHKAAGEWFLRLYRYRNPCSLKGALDDGGGRRSSDDRPAMDAAYLALVTDKRMSSARVHELAGVIVFHRWPRWLHAIIFGTALRRMDVRHQAGFMDSIDMLRRIWLEFDGQATDVLRARYERQRADSGTL